MKRPSMLRKTTNLSDPFRQQLNMYALAAGAAGVGILALAQSAEGKIVYTPETVTLQKNHALPLDLNHDGTVDFLLLRGISFGVATSAIDFLSACQSLILGTNGLYFCYPSPSSNLNVVRVTKTSEREAAAALRAGAKIQTGNRFRDKTAVGMGDVFWRNSATETLWHGAWVNGGKGVKHRYLGLKFKIKGKFHFGWARLTVTTTGKHDFNAILTGYAYETVPGKAIVAGKTKGSEVATVKPASLGHLAAGASAIPAWRVKQATATTH